MPNSLHDSANPFRDDVPSCVKHASRMISSSKLSVSFPSLMRSWRKAAWLRDSFGWRAPPSTTRDRAARGW